MGEGNIELVFNQFVKLRKVRMVDENPLKSGKSLFPFFSFVVENSVIVEGLC